MNGVAFKEGVAVGVVFGGVVGMSAGVGGIVAVVGVGVAAVGAAVGGGVAEAEEFGLFYVGGGIGCMVSAAFLATAAS